MAARPDRRAGQNPGRRGRACGACAVWEKRLRARIADASEILDARLRHQTASRRQRHLGVGQQDQRLSQVAGRVRTQGRRRQAERLAIGFTSQYTLVRGIDSLGRHSRTAGQPSAGPRMVASHDRARAARSLAARTGALLRRGAQPRARFGHAAALADRKCAGRQVSHRL